MAFGRGSQNLVFCVSPFLLLRRDSSSKPEQILVSRRRPNLAGAQLKAQSPQLLLGSTRKPKGFETAILSRYLDFYQEPRNKVQFKEQTHLDTPIQCIPKSNPKIDRLNRLTSSGSISYLNPRQKTVHRWTLQFFRKS